MRWTAVPAPDLKLDLILFDGDCVLCSRAARFVHRHDTARRFRFVALQSDAGRALAARFAIDPVNPETNAAIVKGLASFKADATLAVLSALPGWGWTRLARLAPKPLRDWFYDRIARNRFRVFGRRPACWVGDTALRARVISSPAELGAP
jgi:predicted DCC family thiol-disulfide oxidoreductase YuxK